ncbi:MAG: hypothetical protein LBJ41_10065 [Treponema sp.]|jgi:uncharacterized membrane protein YhaH (DUF805 family)|nr:hypothetical protein [Treponema sp.]
MLGKLLKYEFKTFLRIMLPFYVALMVLSLLAGLSDSSQVTAHSIQETPSLTIIWGIALLVVLTVNIIMVVQRFRDNLLKNEAYLMLTLPVTRWELLVSKALTAFVSLIISVLALILSVLLFSVLSDWPRLVDELSGLLRRINYLEHIPRLLLQVLVMLIIIFQQVCLIYTVLLVSQILSRFRVLAALGAYILVMYIQVRISLGITSQVPLGEGAIELVFAGLYFWLSGWLLHHTLNIE